MTDDTEALDVVSHALYGVAPTDFTDARNAAAASATGPVAARIKALRKPTVAAWAVNLLVRDGQLGEAVALSAALREAQEDLDAKELADLGRQRRRLVASLARRAAELADAAGTRLSPAVGEAVAQTINAAVMDADVAAAVLTGRLLRPLDVGGLEGLDVREYVAGSAPDGTSAAPAPRNDLAERRARKAAEETARAAAAEATAAKRDADRADERSDTARARVESLRAHVDALRAELVAAEAEAEETADAQKRLAGDRDASRARADAAAREADRARAAIPPRG